MKLPIQVKMYEFRRNVLSLGNLPKAFQFDFEDGSDQRLWFQSICNLPKFSDYVTEIYEIIQKFNVLILDDIQKENEFFDIVKKIHRIPYYNEYYFSDNSEMKQWYNNYTLKNNDFVNQVLPFLDENNDFDIIEMWPGIKDEVTSIIKKTGKFPKYHEVYLQNGLDIRYVLEKLQTFEPNYMEQARLYIANLRPHVMTFEERKSVFLKTIEQLKYIPELQESRFEDGVDMKTWYLKMTLNLPELIDETNEILKNIKPKEVNVYLIPKGDSNIVGEYMVFSNEGEKLDLDRFITMDSCNDLLELKKIDPTFKINGSFILDSCEQINSVNLVPDSSIKTKKLIIK